MSIWIIITGIAGYVVWFIVRERWRMHSLKEGLGLDAEQLIPGQPCTVGMLVQFVIKQGRNQSNQF
jgi:hypothetical protein